MKKQLFTTLFFVLFAFTLQAVFAQKAETKPAKEKAKTVQAKTTEKKAEVKKIWNEVCPVMGNKVNPKTPTAEYKGKTIGFCCAGCDKKFKADPETYMKNLSADGKTFVKK
jgi:YHS domain-containing protein